MSVQAATCAAAIDPARRAILAMTGRTDRPRWARMRIVRDVGERIDGFSFCALISVMEWRRLGG
jgi:hypothetical protein